MHATKRTHRTWLFALTMMALATLSWTLPAQATIIDTLGSWNVSQLNATGDHITVDATTSGANTVLTFSWVYGTQPPTIQTLPTIKGIDEIGWNGPAATTHTGWSGPGSGQMDGFGGFSVVYDFINQSGDTGAGAGPVQFTLPGTSISFTGSTSHGSGPHGYLFAVHVAFGGDCSGFVSDSSGTGESASSDGACGSPHPSRVPEPTALLLLGAGLLGVCGLARWQVGR